MNHTLLRALIGIGCLLSSRVVFAVDPVSVSSSGVVFSTAIPAIDEMDMSVQMVDREFDPTLLENLPTPMTPPPNVALPRVVADKTQWKGSLSGITRPAQIVIRNAETWAKLWNLAIVPYSPTLRTLPPVDFSKEIVVGVFLGEKPDPGYTIEIRSSKIDSLGESPIMTVHYRNRQQMQAVFAPPFRVQPFHLKKLPIFPGRVAFEEDR
jgi:hypothetical protein